MSTITLIIVVLLVLALVGALPLFPHSMGFGYGPSSVIGFILIVLLILAVTGRL